MKKIPTLFERDWNGDRSRVVNQVHAGCEWVLAGEGRATRKLDGTCCMIRDGHLFKRRELRKGESPPPLFEQADFDAETGKTVGWLPCDIGPDNRWHMEAFAVDPSLPNGTYELVGPKVQGNPEGLLNHLLVAHGSIEEDDAPRTFDRLREWLVSKDIEGIVFHRGRHRSALRRAREERSCSRSRRPRAQDAHAVPHRGNRTMPAVRGPRRRGYRDRDWCAGARPTTPRWTRAASTSFRIMRPASASL